MWEDAEIYDEVVIAPMPLFDYRPDSDNGAFDIPWEI